jgi:hypothetical protein
MWCHILILCDVIVVVLGALYHDLLNWIRHCLAFSFSSLSLAWHRIVLGLGFLERDVAEGFVVTLGSCRNSDQFTSSLA